MIEDPDVLVDYDYQPLTGQYEQCETCGQTRTLQHHCDLVAQLAQQQQALDHIRREVDWASKRRLPAHQGAMARIRGVLDSLT